MSKFKTFSKKQLQVLTWWANPNISSKYDAIIADGSIRSGKTMSMSLSFIIWAMSNFNECNFAICGKTVGSCRRNVITPLLQMIRQRFKIKDKRSDNVIIIEQNGVQNSFYIFGGKDESSQDLIQGITLAGVLLDEIALMPQSFVNQATGRCSVNGAKFWFNCNPDTPYHWFYEEWLGKDDEKAKEKKALHLHFTMDDNLTLSKETKERYESMYSGTFYERYIRGLWVAAEGLIYPLFNKKIHVVKTEPRRYTQYYVGVDYGTLNPFSAGLWGKCGNVWYRIREYYYDGRKKGHQKTDEEYYQEVEKLINGLHVTSLIVDPSAASFITLIRRKGRYNVIPAKNDVLDGIRYTSDCLKNGRILFNDCCENIFSEFVSYIWDTKYAKNTGEDRPVKEHDHAMDDMRYFCYTILNRNSGVGVVNLRR
ncbi:MAG: PBSX family phage terminase large subunit [Acutalibacteraceae bacterium]|nr:PBSX family phage terminase large subunit [Acutalibacteraceae bacterium]